MKLEMQKVRRVLSAVLMVTSVALFVAAVSEHGMPGSGIAIVCGIYLVYYIVQFFVKLGLTLPFLFIVFWCVIMIMEWNHYQAQKSFDLKDYLLAMSALGCAMTGTVVYFENKMRW